MRTIGLVGMALLVPAIAFGQYTGPWNQVWDFSDGTQGWTLGFQGGPLAPHNLQHWVDPVAEPNGVVITGPNGTINTGQTANLHLPDRSFAWMDVSQHNLGNSQYGHNGFVVQVDMYIPNLQPAFGNPFNYGYPGNMNHKAGIGVRQADGDSAAFIGRIESGENRFRDYSWDNTWRTKNWVMEGTGGPPYANWWNDWITLQIDYSFSEPGKIKLFEYIPWDGPVHDPGWQEITIAGGIDANLGDVWEKLYIGQVLDPAKVGDPNGSNNEAWSWTKAQFDNVKLAYVPEPASALLLVIGGMALLRQRRR